MKIRKRNMIGEVFINKKDLTKIEKKEMNDYELLLTLGDLGNRGNFTLLNRFNDKVIQFKDGKRIK